MRDVILQVNGIEYRGWKSIRITLSLECLCRSFAMSVSERWDGTRAPWPIREGDRCTVKLGEDTLIDGYVDTRSMSISAQDHGFQVVGRDKAGDLLDCSAVLEQWEFAGISVLEICQKVAAPFNVKVALGPAVTAPAVPRKLVINPGDTAFDVIERACRLAGLFPVSDGAGGVVLTRAGTEMTTTPLAEGMNILEANASYDDSARHRRYIVIGQQQGSDLLYGMAAADVRAEATDPDVGREARVLMVRAEGSVTIQQAQDRANWEAVVRRANAIAVDVTVQGWEQQDGSLWPVNALVQIQAPVLGVVGEMLISEVTYSLSEGGTTTELTLRDPNAFLPQPEVPESEVVVPLEDDAETDTESEN